MRVPDGNVQDRFQALRCGRLLLRRRRRAHLDTIHAARPSRVSSPEASASRSASRYNAAAARCPNLLHAASDGSREHVTSTSCAR